jgi:hypothetical protein
MVINITLGRVTPDRVAPVRACVLLGDDFVAAVCPEAATATVSVITTASESVENTLDTKLESKAEKHLNIALLRCGLLRAPRLLVCLRRESFSC